MTDTCKAGVAYKTVRGESGGYPCVIGRSQFRQGPGKPCGLFRVPTDAQIAATVERERDAHYKMMDDIRQGICPTCYQPMTLEERNRYVYAMPCDHPLYPGRVPKKG